MLTFLSLNTPRIQRNSDMTELSDKTITAACLPAGFDGHTSADYFFRPSTQIQSFERQPWRGNYRNCDRGKILSLYESPLGICCVCQSQSMFSLFDFLHQLVQPVLFCNAGIVFPPVWSQRLHSNSCLTILVPVWFQLSLACPWTMDRV